MSPLLIYGLVFIGVSAVVGVCCLANGTSPVLASDQTRRISANSLGAGNVGLLAEIQEFSQRITDAYLLTTRKKGIK